MGRNADDAGLGGAVLAPSEYRAYGAAVGPGRLEVLLDEGPGDVLDDSLHIDAGPDDASVLKCGVDAAGDLERVAFAGALPLRAGVAAMVGFGLVLVLGDALPMLIGALRGPAAVTMVLTVVVQYLAMAGLCLGVCRRWGTGSLRVDLGFCMRRSDWVDGTIGWLCGVGLVGVVASGLRQVGIPTSTNNPLTARGDAPTASLPQWLAVGLAAVVMVAVAPVLEELLFRGVLLRSLRSRVALVPALIVQALAFGLFHVDGHRGLGNVGLVVLLSTVGLVLGVVAYRDEGRLGGAMIAHGLHNGLAFGIGLAALL